MLKINVKKLVPEAVIPAYAKPGDAGMDLVATKKWFDEHGNTVYGTGIAMEIPEGYVGLIFPRSSNAKTDLYLTNHVGVIDSGYRGEIMFKFRAIKDVFAKEYAVGERIGQISIMPYPQVAFIETDELSSSERGEGGFGSTGK